MFRFKKIVAVILLVSFIISSFNLGVMASELQSTTDIQVRAQREPAPSNNTRGDTVLNGSITIDAGRDMYYSKNVILNGDLTIKEGARLEINGDLTIQGEGNITISENNVALIVKGSLSVLGSRTTNFSGSAALR